MPASPLLWRWEAADMHLKPAEHLGVPSTDQGGAPTAGHSFDVRQLQGIIHLRLDIEGETNWAALPNVRRRSSGGGLQAQQAEGHGVETAVPVGVQQEGAPWSCTPYCD